jgi:hypothetical protein
MQKNFRGVVLRQHLTPACKALIKLTISPNHNNENTAIRLCAEEHQLTPLLWLLLKTKQNSRGMFRSVWRAQIPNVQFSRIVLDMAGAAIYECAFPCVELVVASSGNRKLYTELMHRLLRRVVEFGHIQLIPEIDRQLPDVSHLLYHELAASDDNIGWHPRFSKWKRQFNHLDVLE